jgi:ligand-binding SRPBCC domain-containing protein
MQTATSRARLHDALEMLMMPHHRWVRPKETGAPVRITFERPGGGSGDDAKPSKSFEGHYHWIARHDLNDLKRFRQFVDDKTPEAEPDLEWTFGEWGHYHSFFQEGLRKLSLPPGSVIELGQLVNAQIQATKDKKPKKDGEQKAEHATRPGDWTPEAEPGAGETASGLAKLTPNRRLHVQVVRYEGKQIGILRIPDYAPFGMAPEMHWLNEVMKQLENATDALIIDQLSNPGGYVFQFAEIAGLFAHEKPIDLGTFEARLSETFFAAYEQAPVPDFDHEKFVHDQRLNFAHLTLHRRAMEALRKRFDAGERWSGPLAFGASQTFFLPGQSGQVFARNGAAYSKPVLVLNDERSGSGGDFLPAALQANGRALIFGDTSLGLGGPVYRGQSSMPGSEMSMRCTYGMCYRADGLPIENVGVVPDVLRPLTEYDLRGRFSSYAKDALKLAVRLASGATREEIVSEEAEKLREARKKVRKVAEFDEAVRVLDELAEIARTETNGAVLADRYQDAFARLSSLELERLDETHWRLLRIPLPLVLAKTDPILASLSDADAASERLEEMRALPRYASGTPLEATLSALADGVGTFRKARLSPCLRELVARLAPPGGNQ